MLLFMRARFVARNLHLYRGRFSGLIRNPCHLVLNSSEANFRLQYQGLLRILAVTSSMEICPTPAHLRILIVDDEASVRFVLSDFLSSEGHSTATASDGVEALETFRQDKWDLVLTDRQMPKMTGDELAAAVKEADPRGPIGMITR